MSDKHLELLVGIQKELSTNTEATKNLVEKVGTLDTKVTFTNGKVKKLIIAVAILGGYILNQVGADLGPVIKSLITLL